MTSQRRLLYFVLVPAVVVAVVVLGVLALRTNLQQERASQQTVLDATYALASERADRLDKLIVDEATAVRGHVEDGPLALLGKRWLPTAARETPTVRAVVAVDLDDPAHEVVGFVSSRAVGVEDDEFRRTLLRRLLSQLRLEAPRDELRHLNQVVDGHSVLLSYWQTSVSGRRTLLVLWHEIAALVHEVVPRVFRDVEPGSRMNVIDEEGRIVWGSPMSVGEFTIGQPFANTLTRWRVQVALTSADNLRQKAERRLLLELVMVGFAGVIAIAGVLILVSAVLAERRVAALKSEFVANVSHELKTPLALVRMFGELLLLDRVTTDEKRKQYLSIIVSESERLTALIENVLDFAKVERGKASYEFARGNVADAVARAVDVHRYRAEREGVEVRLTTSTTPETMIDARALELAVMNLLDNALKYAKDGQYVDVSVVEGSGEIEVRVADRGPGIDEGDRERIFDRFVRGKRTEGTTTRGSGIGLSLVKHIAESHGGEITVESPTVEGTHGSTFVLRIPLRPQA